MPNSPRSSSSSRKSATESIPPETATPTRSPALSSSCRRMRASTRSASKCTRIWYRTAQLAPCAPAIDWVGDNGASWYPIEPLQSRALVRDQLPDLLHEIRRWHVLRLFFPARAHIHPSRLRLFVSHHQQEWHFLHGVLANLGIHLFVASIDFDAYANRLQLARDFVGVLRVALTNRNHRHLHWRQPRRERARVVLDQHAKEPLHRSIQRTMHHDRLLARTIFGHIFQAKALGQVEVELHRRKLPQAPDRIHQLDVDLGTIERSLAGNRLVLDAPLFQHLFERLSRVDPLFFAADEILAVVGIPGRELGLELVETKIFQHVQGEFEATSNLIFDLLRRTENVRVILRKPAHAQQAVHHARTLVAIHRAQFAQPHRQVTIRLERIPINQNMPRTIHRLQAIFGVVEFHGVEHVLRVITFVARGEE